MATSQRAALLTKSHSVLKKHYKSIPPKDLSVLDQLLFACCLENASYEDAEKAFSVLQTNFCGGWNEVRVSSTRDLTLALEMLPDPQYTGENVRLILKNIFDRTYEFDLEGLRKLNLGKAVKSLEEMKGSNPFVVGYVNQSSLGGHTIPLDAAALEVFRILGIATEKEIAKENISGVERAIPKSKGVEFTSLLHQFSAELAANPLSSKLHKVLLEISAECKSRLPQKEVPVEETAPKTKKKATSKSTKKTSEPKKKPAPTKKAAAKKKSVAATKPKTATKKTTTKKKSAPAKRKPR